MLAALFLFAIQQASTHATAQARSQVFGTYQIAVCALPCTVTDTAQALSFGLLVIDSIVVDSLTRKRFASTYFHLNRSSLRGCYRLERNHRLPRVFAGITPIGLTAWYRSGPDSIAFELYRSADAWYEVKTEVRADTLLGVGRNRGWGEPDRSQFVLAVRTGHPDKSQCWR